MIEAPEARILSEQLNETVRGKKITDVYTQFSPHKFAWFTGSADEYAGWLSVHPELRIHSHLPHPMVRKVQDVRV